MQTENTCRFLCDMGVSTTVTKWLVQNNYNTTHLIYEKLEKLSDELIFKKAVEEKRIILTFDLDFGEILSKIQAQQPSVIIFRLSNQTPLNVIKHIERILESYLVQLNEGVLLLVTEHKYRIRRLPIK